MDPPWQTAGSIEEIQPHWKPYTDGIDLTSFSISHPPLQLWAARVDLTNPSIQILVGPQDISEGKGFSIKTTTFAQQYECLLALNANPFDPSSEEEGERRRIVGIVVSEGKVLSRPHPKYAALGILADGNTSLKAAVVEQNRIVISGTEAWFKGSSLRYAVGGFFIVLREGFFLEPTERRNSRHARTAVGVHKEETVLFLVVIDGYRQASIGATEQETGIILRKLGASDGLILDGGGSSTLAIRTSEGRYRALNVPMHQRIPHRERAVGVCLGVRYRPIE